MNDDILTAIDGVIGVMTSANVAIPLIMLGVQGVMAVWAAGTGQPQLTPGELAARIEAQVWENRAYGVEELARLRALQG